MTSNACAVISVDIGGKNRSKVPAGKFDNFKLAQTESLTIRPEGKKLVNMKLSTISILDSVTVQLPTFNVYITGVAMSKITSIFPFT